MQKDQLLNVIPEYSMRSRCGTKNVFIGTHVTSMACMCFVFQQSSYGCQILFFTTSEYIYIYIHTLMSMYIGVYIYICIIYLYILIAMQYVVFYDVLLKCKVLGYVANICYVE